MAHHLAAVIDGAGVVSAKVPGASQVAEVNSHAAFPEHSVPFHQIHACFECLEKILRLEMDSPLHKNIQGGVRTAARARSPVRAQGVAR